MCMRNTELLGNHFQSILLILKKFLNDFDFAFGQFVVSGRAGNRPILQIRIVAIVLNHFILGDPFQILVVVVLFVVVEVNNERLIGLLWREKVFGN